MASMFNFFRRTKLSDRQERAVEKTLQQIRAQRRARFRILACIDGTDESYEAVRMAACLAPTDDCDIIALYVRPTDQGLWSGGLQVKLARQNMLATEAFYTKAFGIRVAAVTGTTACFLVSHCLLLELFRNCVAD
jgi:K+-sensing histidine kinase KdpD